MLRLAIERGDLEWETRVRGAQYRLSRTPTFAAANSTYYSDAWAEAHRLFHRTLLEGCGNDVLLETFDRLSTASELARRWSVHPTHRTPERTVVARHRRIEQAAVARDPDLAARLLTEHLGQTAAALTADGSNEH